MSWMFIYVFIEEGQNKASSCYLYTEIGRFITKI